MKKGFTLMELLITIALLSIIGTVIVSNMTRTLEIEQEKQISLFKSRLEKAACVYVEIEDPDERPVVMVKVEDLLKKGLIKEEELYNPETQDKIDIYEQITVTFNPDGTKTCTY